MFLFRSLQFRCGSKSILKNSSKYTKLGIYGLNIDNLSNSFSYRYENDVVYRSEMIKILTSELDKVEGLEISTTSPNSYLYNYLTNYYQAAYESSKYLYETDSIPFISIVLSGYVNLYGAKGYPKTYNYRSERGKNSKAPLRNPGRNPTAYGKASGKQDGLDDSVDAGHWNETRRNDGIGTPIYCRGWFLY